MNPSGQDRLNAEMAVRLGHSVKRVEQLLMAAKANALRPHGLTVPQYATLMALYYVPGQSAAQLARTALVTPQTIATILNNLADKGLITRTTSPLHTKVLVTDLTTAGSDLVTNADKAVKKVEQDLSAAYEAEELEAFREYLLRAERLLQKDGTE